MNQLREKLQRLGWPIDSLTDEEISRELQRRWFDNQNLPPDEGETGVAVAMGVFQAMACDGNLDALCWSEGGLDSEIDIGEDIEPLIHHSGDGDPPEVERRGAPRQSAADFVDCVVDPSGDRFTGWLVDVSAEGIAFIADTHVSPRVGTGIEPTVRSRTGVCADLGHARIVRTELLAEGLSLVCAQLETKWEPI